MSKQNVITPVDGSIYTEFELTSSMQIEYTLKKAESALKTWRETTFQERKNLCLEMVDKLLANVDQIAPELSWQMGRPIRFSPFEIETGFKERARYMIDIAEESLQDIQLEQKSGFIRYIKRAPHGIVLTIAPWNYPYLTAVNSIIPAIMAGNVVVLKHSAQTPLVAHRFADAFKKANFPEGVFQYVHLTHDDTSKLIQDSRIGFVAFTGSVDGGKHILNSAASTFKPIGLELGGKDPAYIRPDVNLEHAIENVADGAFFNSGQSCCAIERIYVHSDIFNAFTDGLVEFVNRYELGDPLSLGTTLGPMVRTSAADFVRNQVAEAISKKATPLIDPTRFKRSEAGTAYLAPQVLINVDHTMAVMNEETFGPVVGVMKVKSDEEALKLMNDSNYGLTASIWTEDIEIAESLGNQINAGTIFMNRCDYLDPALAWTGLKNSGNGTSLSKIGYEQLTQPKSFHLRTHI